ncbi:MAG: DUF805 domain-containing protein [Candidatus Riflebacteria bacterium]|nr:DUF805 domain-containing protein [Candidatus Riflebacteria bacterium]
MDWQTKVKDSFLRYFKNGYNKEKGIKGIFTEGYDGRISVADFWWSMAIPVAINIVFVIASSLLNVLPSGMFKLILLVTFYLASFVVNSVFILPSIKLTAKRLHDLNLSGYWQLAFFVCCIGWIFALYVFFMPGKDEENQYGSAPGRASASDEESEQIEMQSEDVEATPEQEPQA